MYVIYVNVSLYLIYVNDNRGVTPVDDSYHHYTLTSFSDCRDVVLYIYKVYVIYNLSSFMYSLWTDVSHP